MLVGDVRERRRIKRRKEGMDAKKMRKNRGFWWKEEGKCRKKMREFWMKGKRGFWRKKARRFQRKEERGCWREEGMLNRVHNIFLNFLDVKFINVSA